MVFKWGDKKLPLHAAIEYLINTAVDTSGEFDVSPSDGERSWNWEATPSTSPGGGSKDDEDEDPNYHPHEFFLGSFETSSTR